MRGLNAVRLASIAVAALFVLPLLLPLVTALPVGAQRNVPLNVTSIVVTAGGELGFILNRTLLIAGHPVQGAPVLYFWISKNPETVLTGDEFLVATVPVGTAAGVVFGTLLVNATIGGWLGAGVASVYLKVTSARATGATAVVSDAFRLVVDPAIIERVLKVRDGADLNRRERRDFAYYPYFGTSNRVDFLLNLSAIGITASLRKVQVGNITFTLVRGDQVLYVQNKTQGNRIVSNFLNETAPWRMRFDPTYNALNISGWIGNFSLRPPFDVTTIRGIRIGYKAFNLIASVENGTVEIRNVVWAEVVRSKLNATDTRTKTFVLPRVSIGWTKTVNIYPTVTFRYDGIPTVGNRTTLELRNYKAGTYGNLTVAYFARIDDTFTRLPVVNLTGSVAIDAKGRGFITVRIPDNPYGGRVILATVNVSEGWALAGRAPGSPERIYPVLDYIAGFNNAGALAEATFAPGEFILVRGRGFLVERPTIDLINRTAEAEVRIPLEVVRFVGVYENGSWGAIVQIPVGIALYRGNEVILRAYTGDPADTTNIARASGRVELAPANVRVFIEPSPRITRILPTVSARIDLGAEKYPGAAVWEDVRDRRFTLLVYGAPAGALRFNVTLILGGSPVATLGLNVPRTGVGSLLATFNVPEELPSGDYHVRVSYPVDGMRDTRDSARPLSVKAAAAAVDPADNVAKKRVFLPVPANLTIKGFGFVARQRVFFDVPSIGVFDAPVLRGPAAIPSPVETDARGSFEGWIDLTTIITAPGTYIIKIHQSPEEAEIIVTIGVPPPFTVKVVTGAAKFADLPLDIWVVAFYGGSVARQDQVVSVSVAVYLRVGAETRVSTLTPTVAVPGQAIFHASYTPPADALGKDLLVVATATGRFSPIAPTDTAADVASAAIPPVRLSDLVAAVTTATQLFDQALAALSEINAALGEAVRTIRGDIEAVRSDIANVRALVLQVKTDVGTALDAILTIRDQNIVVLSKLDELGATITNVASGVATVKASVEDLAELLKATNSSISKLVIDQAGNVILAISDSEGRIVGAIKGNASAIIELISAVGVDVKAVLGVLKEISDKLDAINTNVGAAREDILRQLNVLLDIATAIRGGIEAVREDITGVRALVIEVNTNVGIAIQAILTVADQNKVVLSKLDELNAAVAGGVAAVRTDVAGLAGLLRAANLSISRLVVDQAGRVVAAISDSEGRIVGAVRAEASAVRDLVSAVRGDVRAVSDALAAFQSGAFSKLDAIASSVDAARGDILRINTGLTAAATVITDIQGAVREVRTTVGGIATTVDTIKTTVDRINAAVPNIATKADVTGAASDVKSAVDAAKGALSGAVAEAKDTAATSARNWGIINAILIIIAIAILAYATFVARRG